MDAEKCAACGTKPRYGFPFKECSECKRCFHSKKCLKLISIGNQQTIHLCACCELKRREREIEIVNKRHSGSSNTITHTTATKNQNTTKSSAGKALRQSASPASTGVRRVTGSQADLTINTQAIIVSNTGTITKEHISQGGKNKNINNNSKININNNNNNLGTP